MLTQTQREDKVVQVERELGIDRMGTGPDAPALPSRTGIMPGAILPIEEEIFGAQMLEAEVWARPGLPHRIRSFLTMAALQALGHLDQLYRHINIALNLGITPDEIHETLLHVGNYAGLPTWQNAVPVAREVFVHRGILLKGAGVKVTPRPAMDHLQRRAARDRVCAALNIGRVGPGPDAPQMKALPGGIFVATGSIEIPLGMEFANLHADHGFGEIWGRPGLEIKIRSYITVTVLQVLNETNEMQIHMNNALNLGISQDELYEALAHVGLYGGYSGWHTAALIAGNVFAQHKEAQEAAKAPMSDLA